MGENKIQDKINELKNLSVGGIKNEGVFSELDNVKSILDIIKSEKPSKEQLEEIIKFLDEQTRGVPEGDFIKFHELSKYKSDYEKLLSDYSEEKKSIVIKSSSDSSDLKNLSSPQQKTISDQNENIKNGYDNSKALKTYESRLNIVLNKLDVNDIDEKELKELLKKTILNPSSTNIENLQNFMIEKWNNIKVSKDGKVDGKFGPRTMAELERIAGIEQTKIISNKHSVNKHSDKGKKKQGNKTNSNIQNQSTENENANKKNIQEYNQTVANRNINREYTKTSDYRNIVLDEKTNAFIKKWDLETILKELSRNNLDKKSSLYKLRVQLEKNNINPRDYLEKVKSGNAIISVKLDNLKRKDNSIMSGEFLKNGINLQLINGTRKYPDGRVMIYKEGNEVNYTLEYMALMAVMIGVDLAGFTGVGTVPSLAIGTSYDLYDLTQKEDAGWQILKKIGLVDPRYYPGDKGILEYFMNVLGLVPGMTAATKSYKIRKFYKGLNEADKLKFNKLQSFIKDKLFGIGETAAKKGDIGLEYSKEANDLEKAIIKTVKKGETIKETKDIFNFSKIDKEISSNLKKLKVGESFEVGGTKINKVKFGKNEFFEIEGNNKQFAKLDDVLKLIKQEDKNTYLIKKTENLISTLKDDSLINIKVGDELYEVSKSCVVKIGKDGERLILDEASKSKFMNENASKIKEKIENPWYKFTKTESEVKRALEEKYGKEKCNIMLTNLKKSLNWLKYNISPALGRDIDAGLNQFIKDILLSKWNFIGAFAGAGVDQFLLDDYVDGPDRLKMFFYSVFAGYITGTAFNIGGKVLKYSGSSFKKIIWNNKGKIIIGGAVLGTIGYVAFDRTNYDSWREMFDYWLKHNHNGGSKNPETIQIQTEIQNSVNTPPVQTTDTNKTTSTDEEIHVKMETSDGNKTDVSDEGNIIEEEIKTPIN